MKKININKYRILLALLIFSTFNFAQTCGFGCLGLSGFYAGYSEQKYNAEGLNEYLNLKISSSYNVNSKINFTTAKGYRIGANIFRAKFDDYFLTAKAYYQYFSETQNINLSTQGNDILAAYELKTNHWGVGIDFGVPVFSFLDFKVLEGGVNFYLVELNEKLKSGIQELSSEKYSNNKLDIGYYFGSGLILHIIKDYVSLEATAVYSVFKIKSIDNDSGLNPLKSSDGKDLITNKSFSTIIQLNLGFPL